MGSPLLSLTVNNVGVSYPYPEYYLHIPDLDGVSNLYLMIEAFSCRRFCD